MQFLKCRFFIFYFIFFLYDKAAEYWKQAIYLAPNNYIEAQNWLKTVDKIENKESTF